MPRLDVSDVLLDPEFVDTSLVCIRNSQTVGDDGIAVDTQTSIPFFGVVTNDTGDILIRQAQGEHITGSITIHTRFRLSDGSTSFSADEVAWQGATYTVSNVANWSTYGRGFVAATCDLKPLSGGDDAE